MPSVFIFASSLLILHQCVCVHHKLLVSQKLCSVEEIETLPAGTKSKDITWRREFYKKEVLNNFP